MKRQASRQERTRLAVGALAVLLAGLTFAGCSSDTQDHDLCGRYDDLVASVDGLQQLDPQTAGIDQLRQRADDVQGKLDELQATSEGQLNTAISTLRTAVADLRQSVVDAGASALTTARPLIEDAVTTVKQAYANVQAVADVQCSTPTT
ncbi:hypothetical protein [Luteimicrobium sp. DT211]|uniref:hypothetical protein n=1 Tax=Luteimicrobium sp. DT211 TaxID=3393412 RepID=UPI003CE9E01F